MSGVRIGIGFAFGKVEEDKDNIFSGAWNDSDVVLVLKGRKFHVHRSILSLQSEVFKVMFNGNFKDAKQNEIELNDDDYNAMLEFIKLLYPKNMLDKEKGKVKITDANVHRIVQVADKYGAINVIKQCFSKLKQFTPENTMRLLPYALRHKLPDEKILDVIIKGVPIKELEKFAPELDNEPVYKDCLVKKIEYLEKLNSRWKRY